MSCETDNEEAKKLDTDTIPFKKITSDGVFKEIGEFGHYQLLVICLIGFSSTLSGLATYQGSFTEATPQFRCRIPNLENDTYEISSPHHQTLVDLYIPKGALPNTYKGCSIRLNASEVECNSWVYSKEFYARTIVTDWDLVCSHAEEKGLYRFLFFVSFFGVFSIGLLGDAFGRKKIISVFVSLSALFFVIQAVSLNFITDKQIGKSMYGLSRPLIGYTSNVYTLSLVLSLELVGPSYRVMANNFMFYFFVLGQFVVLFFSYFVPDYRKCSLYMAVLVSLMTTYFWWIPESVRYLIGSKQYARADAVFRKIAKSNKKVIVELRDVLKNNFDIGLWEGVYAYSAAHLDTNNKQEEQDENKIDFRVFFSNWKLLGKIFFSFLQFFIVTLVYYGIGLNTDNLSGNPYLNFLYSASVEMTSLVASQYFLKHVGRKIPYLFNFLMVGLSLIAIGFVPENMPSAVRVLVLTGKFFISFNFNALEMMVAESFPTVIRNSVLSLCFVAEGFGSTLSTYLALLSAYWMPLPYIVYGVLSAFAGITYFLIMPETKDLDMPENLSDVIQLSSKVKAKTMSKS